MAYPKWLYHRERAAVIVESPEQEKALGSGWEETPAAFDKPEKPAKEPKAK